MEPIIAANYLATLVGLICNWKAERGSAAADKFQDFLNYLLVHHFEILRSEILASRDLQSQLETLLSQDLGFISEKLNLVCQGLSSLSDKVDALAPLVRSLGATTEELSDQAMSILKVLEQSGSTRAIMFRDGEHFGLLPHGGQFGFSEAPRFIVEDMEALVAFGLLNLVEYNNSGDPIYSITRRGVALVKDKPEIRDPQGKLIGTPH